MGAQSESSLGPFAKPAPVVDGILEYATASDERDFYEAEYDTEATPVPNELEHVDALWRNPYYPVNRIVREAVGDVAGKTVVCLGNGASAKELAFRDGRLVITDLAAGGLKVLRTRFPTLSEDVTFATVDAQELPFEDKSVDVLYGYAFAHHLPDLERFLREAIRVTRGRAVFMDDGYSPIWQRLKLGPLRRLMSRSHERHGISPEDAVATVRGGFKEKELIELMPGVSPFFIRTDLIHYFVTRAGEKLPLPVQPADHPRLLRALTALDRFAPSSQRIRLVWGFATR